jgi:hypothetical protein
VACVLAHAELQQQVNQKAGNGALAAMDLGMVRHQ